MGSESGFDIVVVGGGHAGCEAAHAAAKMGLRVVMITLDPDRIGVMSCNPAIGGLAKGQLVKEIDALGGLMGRVTDQTAIQYRVLNSSKGPAVRSTRAQCDKDKYSIIMRAVISSQTGLEVKQGEVVDVTLLQGRVSGVVLATGEIISCKCVVITSGTFLQAVMHVGALQSQGGRLGDRSAQGLSQKLGELGFRLRRLKTGTPPRLHRQSIDWAKLSVQPGDENPEPFSFDFKGPRFPVLPQVCCHITYTNARSHKIIEDNLFQSPMFTGAITGVGPRYCPSIEDKVNRFKDKDRHQLFLEPEGLDVDEVYVNGISTSLPREVQEEFVRSIDGLERAEFIRYGYAVEYDAVDARQLKRTYESKDVPGLFFAGQVNGTSGYEEAAAQGILAGINAALRVKGEGEFVLGRHEAYLGVLADDLTLKGSDEPYRMFTSRAEYRLLLREDNADLRLTEKGYGLGLIDEERITRFRAKRHNIEDHLVRLKREGISPSEETNAWLESHGTSGLLDRTSWEALLRRPEVNWASLKELGFVSDASRETASQIEIQVKYAGYIERDLELLKSMDAAEGLSLPGDLDYGLISGLSNEIKAKLKTTRPESLGQAARISGVTPAAVANILIFLRSQKRTPISRPELQ